MKYGFIFLFAALLFSCKPDSNQKLTDEEYFALSEEQRHSAEYALEGLDLYDPELEVTLFASEPMMINPTNMDIDDKGRVWICEGYNYRNKLNPRNPYNKKGDRILILEDTDKDGKADKSTVFYQGEDVNSALGISVVGNRVIVSCSPNVLVFTDADGDDVPDKKEILFSGIGGEQHDHGVHAFTFGPDGKFYFNYGNAGKGMLAQNGKPLLDDQQNIINNDGKPYREGMVYRCDPNGTNVEILAWNFRNNYELTVDSYGRMWQSDNDDDGNRGTRINYVMDYGNYGFKDEITGSDWRTRRVNLEDSIYQQHWHLNDPGVVPNLLQTYAGSPTGITIYEGDLLPEKYQNQLLHTDAGPNILRAYPVQKDGAGFKAELIKILDGSKRDNWFRPSDVTVAPDGSIFVADWYDPGVGGHAIGDLDKGRIYRIAPRGHKYNVSAPNYQSKEEAVKALQSPNTATKFNAYVAIKEMGAQASDVLLNLYENGNDRMKARALWLLSKIDDSIIEKAAKDNNEDIRVTAVRAARINNTLPSAFFSVMANDTSSQVRREVALAIRHKSNKEAWKALASSYKGNDRWYLEALGIAADGNWDEYLPAYIEEQGSGWIGNKAAQDIVWRSRAKNSPALLSTLIDNADFKGKLRYYRALDFQDVDSKNAILLSRLEETKSLEEKVVIFRQMDLKSGPTFEKFSKSANELLSQVGSETDFLDIVKKFRLKSQEKRLLDIVYNGEGQVIAEAANTYIDFFGINKVREMCTTADSESALRSIERFGLVDNKVVTDLLISIFQNEKIDIKKRETAMEAMNGWNSEETLWELMKANKVPKAVLPIAQKHMLRTWHADIRAAAEEQFGEEKESVDVAKLRAMSGNEAKGKEIFKVYCVACHMVNGEGIDFGPGLSEIGSKLSKQGLYNAILYPSEGMGFGYETQLLKLKNGEEVFCIVTSKTENEVNVKLVGQAGQTQYARNEIMSIEQQDVSLMPKFPLQDNDLVDLVEYLRSLK
ncbi:putative membrane-bound dehydrogenase domain-containing protein [Spirosomataceae bacterium TFI 002]|nr:putative membrane-bound dehydrogenase domain-containing protein [Spirosomataceae bacterium TFI 002]